ncbi:MAG: hypothetical protein IPI58_06695 [Alphaproteobacteria bacterium]|nr:MAG: hypothetical protein IPI58_06695 [Alphaproteobacteria bacterium]
MRLKSFQAATLQDALGQVRTVLGQDAIIVATHEEADGVRVTAALESDRVQPWRPPDLARATPVPARAEGDALDVLGMKLAQHRLPPAMSERLLLEAARSGFGDPAPMLAAALRAQLRFAPLESSPGLRPILLIGPPGAGKTAMTARLATRAVLAGQRPLVINADHERAGARAQWESFSELLDIPLTEAFEADDLRQAALEHQGQGPVLIDSAGCNPYHRRDLEHLRRLASTCHAEPVLVLPAGLDRDEAAELAQIMLKLGARRMMTTRLDLTRRLGSLMTAAEHLALAEASASPDIADSLDILDPAKLAQCLLRPDDREESDPS